MSKNIIVGLSGGVDSAVTAWLLKEQGFNVTGLFMKNWEDDDDDEYCSSRQDLIDSVSVAEKIGIDIQVVNFAQEYKEKVFSLFIDGIEKGITPNPDILCNSEIKFNAFLDHALKLGADKIATGHYANVNEINGKYQLSKGDDGTKDQSYFLYRLNQAQLSKSLFPLTRNFLFILFGSTHMYGSLDAVSQFIGLPFNLDEYLLAALTAILYFLSKA